jgi:hypothetical protein
MFKIMKIRNITLGIAILVCRNRRGQIVITGIELRLEVIVDGKREVLHAGILVTELTLKIYTVITFLKDRL